MESQDKLELAKGFPTLRNDSGSYSLIKNIDDQFDIYRREIDAIDQELKVAEDKERRKETIDERKKAVRKSSLVSYFLRELGLRRYNFAASGNARV